MVDRWEGRRLGAILTGVLAFGCAASAPAPEWLPSAEERRASEAAGFELPPVLAAADLVDPARLSGENFEIAPTVTIDAGSNHVYTIESSYGSFTARGDEMLETRIREVDALAALDQMSASAEFGRAAARAVTSPFVATWNLVTHPVDSIAGIPKGAWEFLRRSGELARSDRGELEDSALVEFIGFESRKRQIAGELGIDPYTSNRALQRRLNRFAWAVYAGGLPSMFVPFSEPRGALVSDGEPAGEADRLSRILSSYSPEDLARLNRIELAVMGVPEELSLRFIQHPWYSPRHETALVKSLSALELTGDRGAFIEAALTAESEEDARAYQREAELMRRYDGGVGHIEKIVRIEGTVTGFSESGVLVVPLAADHAVWSRPTANFAKTFTDDLPDGIEVRETALLLSGSLSPKARAEFRQRGVRVIEHALDRLPAETDTDGE